MPTYSHSRLSTYENCPQQYKLKYIDRIKPAEAAVGYARNEGITTITGSDSALKITEEKSFEFPRANEEGREELEEFIRESGIWEEVSGLNLARLQKFLNNEELDEKMKTGLLKFAEEIEKTSVRLVKKREEEE